jgi:multiple sugar transport system substrate-binding protein
MRLNSMKKINPQTDSIMARLAQMTQLLLMTTLLLFVGCKPSGEDEDPESGRKRLPEGTTMKLVVVDDAVIAGQIRLQSGTWETKTGATLEVIEWTAQEYEDAASLEADVLIAPPYDIGDLVARDWIRSPSLLNDDGPSLFGEGAGEEDPTRKELRESWEGHFSHLREREARWGKEVLGVPMGSPVFVLYYRRDLLEQIDREPPSDWVEYIEIIEFLNSPTKPEFTAVEPVGPGWGGLSLLARAAPYALSPDDYSFPFDINTMEPLIAGPAFVRALDEMKTSFASAGTTVDYNALEFADPDAVRRLFWEGRTALAVTWPAPLLEPMNTSLKDEQVGVAFLPGSPDATPGSDETTHHVPLLSMSGRMGFVAATAEQPDYATELLLWLASKELGTNTVSRSGATGPFRADQTRGILSWVEPMMGPQGAIEYADAITATFNTRQCALSPRIPGRDRYLAALDQAVQDSLSGTRTPQESLDQAAAEWNAVTQELGVDVQREAYRKSLGIR